MSQSRQDRLLESLLALPGNTTCADCKSPAPRWASVNLGIFICVSCASIHRSLGTHTSRVKSVTMDTWTREMVDRMREMGNARANAVWNPDETRHPPPVSTAEFGERQGEMERFIRDKYEAGLFRADRPRQSQAPPRPAVKEPSASSSSSWSRGETRRQDSWNTLGIPEAREPRRRDTAEERATTYGYNGYGAGTAAGGSSGTKRAATRAHVDSNWADFMASEPRPSSGGGGGGGGREGRKAGRLLGMGMVDGYDGEVRLPPVTKAPEGLRYKQDGVRTADKSLATTASVKESPLPPPPQPPSQSQPQSTVSAPAPAPDPAPLINLDATAPMQRSFPQPAPLPSPLPFIQPTTNPFLSSQPQPFLPHLNPSIHNGGYLSASSTPLQEAPFGNPFMSQMGPQMQGFYTPGPATTGMGMGMGMGINGYFGGVQAQGGMYAGGQPSFGQQGYAYGGSGR
ncbi:hypothetical protein NliqN6_5378 [Naganishia liquefaciens]|uniref:Arf-GAP domain-containing protein n=1 Tax=Naganishia liquefaciens TaxID=104408 RepID=A0A8H3YIW9_9TREE|nr:hypothetical protein NliqN6_5378 [Naganishia liquefaciens]